MAVAYAVVIGNEERFERIALRGLRRCAAEDDRVMERRAQRGLATAYNDILREARSLPALDALVLLHEDLEILDPSFRESAIRAVARDDVAIAGALGASDVRSLAWWRGSGRGRLRETRGEIDFGGGRHDVEAVDGSLLVLSPWALRTLEFDESIPGYHGYDVDLCFQARHLGRRVVVDDFPVFHHTKGGYGNRRAWLRADRAWRRKWRLDDDVRTTAKQVARLVLLAARRRGRALRAAVEERRGPNAER